MSRKLKLIQATEPDRVTTKGINANGIDYESMQGEVFEEYYPIEVGAISILIPTDSVGSLRTSTVQNVEQGNVLVVTTKNTVYFFEVLEG